MTSPAADGLAWLNRLPAAEAERELLACCAARAWAGKVATGRPYADRGALITASDAAQAELTWADVEEALAAHPRIGDRAQGADREAAWSRGEQSGVGDAAAETRDELAAGNAAYEQRFGHVFLICATGLPAGAMLAELQRRLGHDRQSEQEAVRVELREITRLRLQKLLGEEAR
jgi:2-oxo-4-hydroxy-4-carboxy-5-ureidoimidazoline decarboxylase